MITFTTLTPYQIENMAKRLETTHEADSLLAVVPLLEETKDSEDAEAVLQGNPEQACSIS